MNIVPRLLIALTAFWLAANTARADAEIAKLHILLVLDTDDEQGLTWGRDGANMNALFDAAFTRQNLAGRFSIDVLVGREVTSEKILDYYRTRKIGPDDGLVFYYSGHGAYHLKNGHLLALKSGLLYRKDLIEAMNASKPKLCVVLTDCCANLAGGALVEEPKGARVVARSVDAKGSGPKAKTDEPTVAAEKVIVPRPIRPFQPPRQPNRLTWGTFVLAKKEEPPFEIGPGRDGPPKNAARAKIEEPRTAVGDLNKAFARYPGLPLLWTSQGKVPMIDVVNSSDGEVMRHLFFRHTGLVDINASRKGDSSFGTIAWGGSLFTNAFIALQRNKIADLDANKNRVAEWSEFFQHLRRTTNEAADRIPEERLKQVPEAAGLGRPVLDVSTKP